MFFPFDAIMDLFPNMDIGGERYITVDVAHFGDDKTVIMVWEGLHPTRIRVLTKSDTDATEPEIRVIAAERVPLSRILVDEDDVGDGIVDHLKCKGFVGGSSPIRDERAEERSGYKADYQHLRAQCYDTLYEYVVYARIAIQSDNEEYRQLIAKELDQIKGRDVDADGKLNVIAKEKIKEHLERSPDFADTLTMRMWFELDPTPKPPVMWL